jgi:hypothetical protein
MYGNSSHARDGLNASARETLLLAAEDAFEFER